MSPLAPRAQAARPTVMRGDPTMTDAPHAAPGKAGRRQWLGLLVLALPCLLVTMDLTVLFLAVPTLTEDLAPSSTQLLWITDVYGFLIAGSLIVAGALG